MMPGAYRCGCNASYGQECNACNGVEAEDAELRKAGTSRYRQQLLAERAQPATTEDEK